MAHGLRERHVPLQQALHGYSEGHRLLASSIDLPSRDAKTLLMMSDASGPAATIDPRGYLTGYPLTESGYYALARTWPAPELPRPGCVWTHTILIDFSDIPALSRVSGFLKLFRRPQDNESSYRSSMDYVYPDEGDQAAIPEDVARRILSGLYGDPAKPIVSAASDGPVRDALVLAIWGQQWPRLRRAFRFCTLSFSDRSSTNSPFDLQFLPSAGRVRSTQFKGAIDVDRRDLIASDWLEDAVSDISSGSDGSLRRFLRAAGSDVGGRESFEPLATLHALSQHFDSDPVAVERAISLLERAISSDKGYAARSSIVRAAAAVVDRLSPEGLQFVLRNFDQIDPVESDLAAERLGLALWRLEPKTVFGMQPDPVRGIIAERAIAAMPSDSLIEGMTSAPGHLLEVLKLRPDLVTETAFWSLEGAARPDILHIVARSPDLVDGAIDSMIRSGARIAREARSAFGADRVLRRLLTNFSDFGIGDGPRSAWFSAAASDGDAVARVLVEGWPDEFSALEAIAHATTPDAVPNAYGDDPWLVALRRLSDPLTSVYLASFLLVRALGRSSMNRAELLEATFDIVYRNAEQRALPEDAWGLLDRRLDRSFWWHDWDRCVRLRHTVVSLYLDRRIDALSFAKITSRDELFAELIGALSERFGSQRDLKALWNCMNDAGMARARLGIVKHAIW